jgi:PAS domain S-box-containing protein
MAILSQIPGLSPLLLNILDTSLLALSSGLSIWFFIFLPEKRKDLQNYSNENLINAQKLNALSQIAIISSTDELGNIIYVNENFCKISGYTFEELKNKNHRILNSHLHSSDFFKKMWSTLKEGKPWSGQIRNFKKNGDVYWVNSYIVPIFEANGSVRKYISIRFDITHEKLIEENLEQEKMKSLHMARLSAIGEMAGGIAHEINNPLTIIKGLLFQIERKIQHFEKSAEIQKMREGLEKSQVQITRITKIINALRSFSRSDDSHEQELISVKNVFETVKDLCFEKLKNQGIQFSLTTCHSEFKCNLIQIEQVLVNLINNSIDAISDLPDPWIKLEAKQRGDYLEISVTDSGTGISQDIVHKIMQPFFTTKEIGKGTGLGLSISRGIIEKHGGMLYLDSSSQNTRLVIQMPINESSLLELINIEEAINAHNAWKEHLLHAIAHPNDNIDCDKISADNLCALGAWIERIGPHFIENEHFQRLKNAHSKFHLCAGNIVKQIKAGDPIKAEIALGKGSEYNQVSHEILEALNNLNADSKTKVERIGQTIFNKAA